jgi:nucleoside-diphosphate-sugar epimerase
MRILMSDRLLFLGFGYVARHLARRIRTRPLAATARSGETRAALAAAGIEAFDWSADGADPAAFLDVGAILVSTPPDEAGCPALRAAGPALARMAPRLRWVGYLSATSVYGDAGGDFVFEHTPARPDTERGRRRLAAENAWRAHAGAHRYPLGVFRIAGIYGPGRSALDEARAGTARRVLKPGHVTNRIHVADIASALAASLANPAAGDLFNLADDLPAPSHEVVAFACGLLGIAAPPLVPLEAAGLSGMALSFYADNKRVSNRRMKEALGVRLRYPTYKEGLQAIRDGAPEDDVIP